MPGAADDLTVLAYKAGAIAARRLPGSAADVAARVMGAGMATADVGRRRLVERHLERVNGRPLPARTRRAMARQAFESYARYWVEAFRLGDLSPSYVDDHFTHEGLSHVDDALAVGKGAILALPHLGGWEFAGAWMHNHGYELTVVVEPLQPPELFEWFVALREALGLKVVALGNDAGTSVLGALRRNEVVCLLCDRDIGGNGVEVDFFGERTTLPGGPATISLRTGAALLPTAVYFTDDGGHHGVVHPPLALDRSGGGLRSDVARVTQSLAGELEVLIRRAPHQWHLMQPNWPSDRA